MAFTYTYAEDGQSYTYGMERDEKEPYERVISLAELQIPDLVKKPAGELARGKTAEYDEEGLPLRIGMYFTKDSEGNKVEQICEFSYRWETGATTMYMGAFKPTENATVLNQIYEYYNAEREDAYLVFDDHGYLAAYYPLGIFEISFHYYYE